MNTITIRLPNSIQRKASASGENITAVASRLLAKYFSESKEKMPPESRISKKLIAAVKRSERDYKAGRYVTFKTKEESDAYFAKLWK